MNPELDDLLAYLIVLNSSEVKLTEEEQARGYPRMLGCLSRVLDFVGEGTVAGHKINVRERLNEMYPVGHSGLTWATDEVALLLYGYYKERSAA